MIVTTLEIVFAVAYFSKHLGVASICHTEMGSDSRIVDPQKRIGSFFQIKPCWHRGKPIVAQFLDRGLPRCQGCVVRVH